MNFIDFREAFTKVARANGMGEAVNSSIICHKARELIAELMPAGGFEVESFRSGKLCIIFESSSALTRFSHCKEEFLARLPLLLEPSFHGEKTSRSILLRLVVR